MEAIQQASIDCPYCGESIVILLDVSVDEQQYIEDCQVCCRPIVCHVRVASDGRGMVEVRDENEA